MARLDTVRLHNSKTGRTLVVNAYDYSIQMDRYERLGYKRVSEELRRSEGDEGAEAQAAVEATSKAAAGGGGRTQDTKKKKKKRG